MKRIIIILFLIIFISILALIVFNKELINQGQKKHSLSYEERVDKYRHARNIIVADKAFSKKERDEMLKKIEENYFPDGDLPEETEEDRQDQEKYRKLITSFKFETDKIANDKSLSKEEKKKRIGEIIKNFIRESGN